MRLVTEQQTVCMFTPSADGGHPLYTAELMTAMAAQPVREFRYELVSAVDLEPQFRDGKPYTVHPVLPLLKHKNLYSNKLAWGLSRVWHYFTRELQFLSWLRNRPDVTCVHLQEWKRSLALPFVRSIRRQGKRVCFTVHNVYPHKYPKYVPKWFVNRISRAAMRRCDGLFVLSRRLETELAEFLGAGHPPIFIAPHGTWTVADAEGAPPVAERLATKKLLFFGSIRANKGLDVLLHAAEQLEGYSITIAGEPWEPEYFKSKILPQIAKLRSMGMTIDLMDRFIADAEVGPLFKSHAAIVLPYTNGFVAQSGVVYMALAYGLPVVASEAGGLRDLMRETRIGVSFDGSSPGALAAAVRSLEGEGARHDLARGLAEAKEKYSWATAARATIAAYAVVHEGRRQEHVRDDIRPAPAH
jgi:glycosyltransferase involved in cell wall biosynthesis